jgi:hypothetical protein
MFTELMLHGPRATLLWNYREVAVITAWRIIKAPRAWVLTARVERADAWQCQQAAQHRELVFTAQRERGRWCWPVADLSVGGTELRATLGPPLQ